MDQILLYTNHIPQTTSIHNAFIENYMLEANGDYVKVYLYLAKCMQYQETGLSISALADRMDNTEKDVIRALQYWEKRKLLQLDREEQTGLITGIHMLLPEQQIPQHLPNASTAEHHAELTNAAAVMQETFRDNVAMLHPETAVTSFVSAPLNAATRNTATLAPAASTSTGNIPMTDASSPIDTVSTTETSASASVTHVESKVVPLTENHREVQVSSQMMQELASNNEFVWTCHVIESYLDRPMKPNETRLVSYLYGTLHFSKDLLLYLYEYCISLGKTNNNYIQAVALSWDEQGVTTPEEAEKVSTAYNSAYNAVSKSLALGRALATVEKKCVDRWQHTWHMDLSVILEACNRTILKIHKADFKYIEGILDHWQKNGVHTLQDVEKADLAYAQSKENEHPVQKSQPQNKSRNQFQNFQQRNASTQEVDDLERKLLMR